MNYVVTSDSTCDLSKELIAENNVQIMPLAIIIDGNEYRDGVDITSEQIIKHIENGGNLPKTTAISIGEYEEFFKKFTEQGLSVIHFNISSGASSCHSNAKIAADGLENVYVVDTKHLSSGQGLLVLKACDMLREGNSVPDTYNKICSLCDKVQTSFVLDRLDILHKGGRCSLAQLLGAKLLKLHPSLYMTEGSLKVKRKYMGSLQRALDAYVNDLFNEYANYDKTRCFVTHCCGDRDKVDSVIKKVKEKFDFKEVIETQAGSTVTSHCGRNTIGVLFITD